MSVLTSETSQESSKTPPHVGKGGFSGQRTQLCFFEALGGAAFEPATGGCFVDLKIWRSEDRSFDLRHRGLFQMCNGGLGNSELEELEDFSTF